MASCNYTDPFPSDFASFLVQLTTFSEVLGIILVVASIGSYFPQHVKLIQTRTSKGLSPYMLFLLNTQSFCSAANSMLLKFPQLEACSQVGFAECAPSLLSLFQLVGMFICTLLIYLLYFPLEEPLTVGKDHNRLKDCVFPRALFGVFGLFVAITVGLAIWFIMGLGPCSQPTVTFGQVMGTMATVVNIGTYLPQIWTTYKNKSVGAYSIIMVAIQAPGAFLSCAFMIFFEHDSFFVWVSFLTAGIQQVILLTLLVRYHFREKKLRRTEQEEPLLSVPKDTPAN